jgi:putative glycosyltransferase (TIGR04372 family)
MAFDICELIKEKKSKLQSRKTICTTQTHIANRFLLSKAKESIKIFPRILVIPIYIAGKLVGDRMILRDYLNAQKKLPPMISESALFSFTKSELEIGSVLESQLGIDSTRPIVTLFIREHRTVVNQTSPDQSKYRNNNFTEFEAAVKLLAESYTVIKMGRNSTTNIELTSNYIIDYASSDYQSDFADFYLSAKADFALCTDSGSTYIPHLMGTKVFVCNSSLFAITHNSPGELFLLKKHHRKIDGKALTVSELLEMDLQNFTSDLEYSQAGIELYSRASDEICEFANEIRHYLGLNWHPSVGNSISCSKVNRKLGWKSENASLIYFSNINEF